MAEHRIVAPKVTGSSPVGHPTIPEHETGSCHARDVLATADGYVLAGADRTQTGETIRAAFWFSSDGLEWTAAPDIPSFGNAEPQSFAVRDGTIVAVGYRVAGGGFAPMAWTSMDGRVWVPVPDTPALAWWPLAGPTPIAGQGALQGTAMRSVHTGWSGFIAVGSHWRLDTSNPQSDGSSGLAIDGAIWRSDDGRAWELLPNELLSVSEPGGASRTASWASASSVNGHSSWARLRSYASRFGSDPPRSNKAPQTVGGERWR